MDLLLFLEWRLPCSNEILRLILTDGCIQSSRSSIDFLSIGKRKSCLFSSSGAAVGIPSERLNVDGILSKRLRGLFFRFFFHVFNSAMEQWDFNNQVSGQVVEASLAHFATDAFISRRPFCRSESDTAVNDSSLLKGHAVNTRPD
jgi:hypothetical protein